MGASLTGWLCRFIRYRLCYTCNPMKIQFSPFNESSHLKRILGEKLFCIFKKIFVFCGAPDANKFLNQNYEWVTPTQLCCITTVEVPLTGLTQTITAASIGMSSFASKELIDTGRSEMIVQPTWNTGRTEIVVEANPLLNGCTIIITGYKI